MLKTKNRILFIVLRVKSVRMKRKGRLAVFENILEEDASNNEDDEANDSYEEENVDKPKKTKKVFKLSDEPIKFICRFKECSEEFSDYYLFDKHLVGHIKQEDFTGKTINSFCEYGECGLRHVSYLHAIQHISLHGYHDRLCNLGEIVVRKNSLPKCTLDNVFTCPETEVAYVCEWKDCNLQLDTIYNFLSHVNMHVNGNPTKDTVDMIKCEWAGCEIKYPRRFQLRKHMPVHTKSKYLACLTCKNTFASIARFSDHRSKQMPKEKQCYKCSQCLKLYASESLLRNHVRAHINQYKCPLCEMTCPRPAILISHIRFRHLDDRRFKCNLCEHTAITKQNLEQHLITHCAEMLLACDECDFRCRSMVTLDRHIQKEHLQNEHAFECHICKKQYPRGNYLTKHLMSVHSMQRPSGHSRFRYRRDPDGISRLQTIRYETVNVIKEIIESKKKVPQKKVVRCHIKRKRGEDDNLSIEVNVEEVIKSEESVENRPKKIKNASREILMTISDIDDGGNIVSEVTESQELIIPKLEQPDCALNMMEL